MMLNKLFLFLLLMVPGLAYGKPTPFQTHAILNGWHAPYSDEFINEVISSQPIYLPVDTRFQFEFTEPANKNTWYLFLSLHALDIYTTYRGLKYDCVYEANPLLPRQPRIGDMLLLKVAVLGPVFSYIDSIDPITDEDLAIPNLITGLVVLNNIKVTKQASKNCNKR